MIAAVVLAAGKSTRMGGSSKALLPVDERDIFISKVVSTFRDAGVDEVVVVLGHQANDVAEALRARGVVARVMVNARFELGQLSSVLTGLDAIDRPEVDAMLLTLVDVPLVRRETVRAVIDRYRTTGAPIVRPVHAAQHGHPVMIDRSLFDVLRRADPAVGAKAVIRAHVTPAGEVEIDDSGAFVDVDTPADYAELHSGKRIGTAQRETPGQRERRCN